MAQDSSTALMAALKSQMRWASTRQSLIAGNIANADTPGYMPKDLPKPDFKRLLQASTTSTASLTSTNPLHLSSRRNVNGFDAKAQMQAVAGLDGNGVDLEHESIEMAKTRDMHSMATGIYRKYNDLMRLTLRGTAQ